jgi:hypothetical protein
MSFYNAGGGCCKRTANGICCHDVQDAQKHYDTRLRKLQYKLGEPDLSSWEAERIQKEIDELPNPAISEMCSNCHAVLKKGEVHARTHDGAFGEYTYYTCGKL